MIDISCNMLNKSFGTNKILDEIDFTINEHEKVALIGLNGSGKTTLLNILTSEMEFDSGGFYLNNNKKIGYLKQSDSNKNNTTIYNTVQEVFSDILSLEQEIRALESKMALYATQPDKLEVLLEAYSIKNEHFEKLEGYGFKSKIRGVLFGLGFNEDEFSLEMNQLSGGQKSRVMLAKLLLSSPDILMLDEPTNHLDISSIEWIEKYIKDFKGTVLLISHDRYFLDKVTNKTLFLSDKKIKVYNGNYSYFIRRWTEEIELNKKKFILQEKEIQKQKEIIAKFLANGRDKKVRQAKSREKMLQNITLLDNPDADTLKIALKFNPTIQSGNDVLRISDLSKSYENKKIFNNVNLSMFKNDKVGLVGPNGIGKTTLLKIIAGNIEADSGELIFGHNVNIGYFDQELSDLNMENSVLDEIWDEYPRLKVHEVRGYLAKFMFYSEDLFKNISDLSGGEKNRVSLLKLMLSKTNFLLMDEPTNHLDIDSKSILENAINDYSGTVLIISHDRYFLNRTVNKILEMTNDGVAEYLGDYDYYIEKKNSLLIDDDHDDSITKTELRNLTKKERLNTRRRQTTRKNIEELEIAIYNTETNIEELETELCTPKVYNDHVLSSEISLHLEKLKKELENLYQNWEILHEKTTT
ncbi:MAG: ABC transporter, ATP-binding protein [Clostridiales bacterium 38_11]|nr:MAG: ABC transporter, ATP-binding protein [Clostridiales bacterium 38_11]HBH13481.1 thiamine ABC transporter substrate-binding protein [Clostridiales bacterium]